MSPAPASGSAPGEWDQPYCRFHQRLAGEQCKTYIAGIPQTGAAIGRNLCPPYPTHPDLVAWPESPAPFFETMTRFQKALVAIARAVQAPLVVGNVGMDYSAAEPEPGGLQLRAGR